MTVPQILSVSILLLSLTGNTSARLWKNAEGTRAIEGELVTIDGADVVLKTPAGKELRFALSFLGQQDQDMAKNLVAEAKRAAANKATEGVTVLSKFTFGDSRKSIEAQVKTIKELKGGVADALRGRVGLSGAYFVMLDGMRYDLHFEFSESDRLTEVSLQSDPFEPTEYDGSLKAAWTRLRSSFVSRYGEPPENRQNGYPERSVIKEGVSMSSDLWDLAGRYLYLGTGMMDGKVSCVLRCSNKSYVPPEAE